MSNIITTTWCDFDFIFTGSKISLDDLRTHYKTQFCTANQVHGTHLILASHKIQEADAIWTRDLSLTPLIQTADCLPILVADSTTRTRIAIHAGWRGVAGQIVQRLNDLNLNKNHLRVYIGPHIQFESFEVDIETGLKIIGAKEVSESYAIKRSQKMYINLSEIVTLQLIDIGLKRSQINIFSNDTLTDSNFYSYRRNKDTGRNYSFILDKKNQA